MFRTLAARGVGFNRRNIYAKRQKPLQDRVLVKKWVIDMTNCGKDRESVKPGVSESEKLVCPAKLIIEKISELKKEYGEPDESGPRDAKTIIERCRYAPDGTRIFCNGRTEAENAFWDSPESYRLLKALMEGRKVTRSP